MRLLPEQYIGHQTADHADHGAGFGCAPGEGTEQENPQQSSVGDGSDRQADFHHMAAAARHQCEHKQQRAQKNVMTRDKRARWRSSASGFQAR